MVNHIESELSVIAKNAYDNPKEGNVLRFRQDSKILYTKSMTTSRGHEFIINIGTKLNRSFDHGGEVAHHIKQIHDPLFVMQLMNKFSPFFDEVHELSHFSLMACSLSGTLNETFDQMFDLRHDRKAEVTLRVTSRKRRRQLERALLANRKYIPENELRKIEKLIGYINNSPNFEIHNLSWPSRKLAILDRVEFHKVPKAFINKLIEFERIYGYKPTVFLFDDSVSHEALTFRMIVNQIAPYANIICFAFLLES
jgi:hypothetical protein